MKNKSFILVLAILISLIWNSQCFSLKEDTHKAINEHVAQNTVNGFSLNTYLRDNLGFERGTDAVLKGVDAGGRYIEQKVFWWLRYGGEQEDRPGSVTDYLLGKPTRSVNHFHNPLLPWDQAGLDDSVFGINFTGQSSVLWSQRPIGTQSPGGYYSWHDAREYFYRALTSGSQTDREKNFAETFRAVGQLMHLVEDASVSMHTRNDIHILYSYEGYVENIRNKESNTFNSWTANAIGFDKSILNLSPNPLAPIPIARIIDTDSYDGTNPNITSGLNIGISEYTNANFFSDDTINSSNFPYPDINQITVIERTAPSGNYPRQYYLKNCCGETNGGQGYLLSAVDYLDYYRQQYPLLSFALPKIPVLDNNVYADYASLLIPRAVGYSAGLLDYFFRGEIDMVIDDGGYGYVIKNNADEDMNGTFELWYDNDKDERKFIKSWSLNIGANSKSSNINFKFPDDAKESCKYILVFKGQMGQEQEAVVGKVIEAKGCHLWGVLVNKNYSEDLSTVTIAFKGNKNVTKQLPLYSQNIIKYKFAEGNPFIFGVLSSQDNYFAVDLFEINSDMSDITHLGEVLRINSTTGYYDTSCDSASQATYSELIGAQDLFISNDGKVIKILGSYKKFVGWKELLRDNISDCGEWSNIITCIGYPEFELGYFINEDRYSLGKASLSVPCESDFLSVNVTVRALNADEQFVKYGIPSLYLNTYTVGMHPSGWGCVHSGTEDWIVKYNEETKIGSNSVYTHNRTQRCGSSHSMFASDGWSELIEQTSSGTAGSIGFVLTRDKGISTSLYKTGDYYYSAISYSSDENGFFCANENDKHQLINSFGEGYFTGIWYSSTVGHIHFTSKFEECSGKSDDSFSRRSYSENVEDVTFWRNGRE